MAEKVDFKKMRKELLEIYESFVKNPEDENTINKAIRYCREFGGLTVYNEILVRRPVQKDIELALNGLSTIYQYGLWDDSHEAFSNEKILTFAKQVLEELRKSE